MGRLTALSGENGRPSYKIAEGKADINNTKYIFEKFGISYEEYLKRKNK